MEDRVESDHFPVVVWIKGKDGRVSKRRVRGEGVELDGRREKVI